jgi:hypothetical protein
MKTPQKSKLITFNNSKTPLIANANMCRWTDYSTYAPDYNEWWLGYSCGCRWSEEVQTTPEAGILVIPGAHTIDTEYRQVIIDTPNGPLTILEDV